jgi:hypothetical protein
MDELRAHAHNEFDGFFDDAPRSLADRALHLGNARTFILTAWWAKNAGADVILRIEDWTTPQEARRRRRTP